MLIILRQYELNTIVRRRDDAEYADLTKARVLQNSVRCNENEIVSALKTTVGSLDFLLYLDLRVLPDSLHGKGETSLPPLEIPALEDFIYHEPPTSKAVKTYRLDYILGRESRSREAPYETVEDGRTTLVIPAAQFETIRSSLECEADSLRDAVSLISAPANGFLSWLGIRLFDDAIKPGRPLGAYLPWAEPQGQIQI